MRTLKLHKFMRRVYKKNTAKRAPVRAMIELTYNCNHRCIHCYNPSARDKKELSTKEVFSVIDGLAGLGNLHTAFTGGEIFTRPDLLDIVFYTRKKGIGMTLMTNGSLITEDMAEKLISCGVSKFEISFLGGTKETFDKMTGIGGSFERVVNAVKMLRRKGVIPQIKSCITNLNIEEIEKMALLAKELDVSFSYSPLVIPRLDLGQEPGALRIGPDEFLDIRKRLTGFYNQLKKPKTQNPKPKAQGTKPLPRRQAGKNPDEIPGFWEKECLFGCMAGHTAAFMDPYGEMKACLTVPSPSWNVKEHTVAECWEKVKHFVDTLKPPADWPCFMCEYNAWCSWCPGRGYLNTGNIFGCPPYFKELAKARKTRHDRAKTI